MTLNARLARILGTSAMVLALGAPPLLAQANAEPAPPRPAAADAQTPAPVAFGNSGDAPDTAPTGTAATPGQDDPMADVPIDKTAGNIGPNTILETQQSRQTVSDEIIGAEVRNRSDEAIGTIDALVFDKRDRIVAGIVSVGGFLGIGAKEVAVDWNAFKVQPEENVVVVMLSREQFEAAPAFRDHEELREEARADN